MTFAGSTSTFKPQAVHPTKQHIEEAHAFLNSRRSSGGTHMIKAVQQALKDPRDPKRYRMAVMFTDAYIGNEKQILSAIEDLREDTRFFAFGIGSSVNRYLIEGIGRVGKGFSEVVTNSAPLYEVAKRWENRLRSPVLTHLTYTLSGVNTKDITPAYLPDLFAGEPLILCGKFSQKRNNNHQY